MADDGRRYISREQRLWGYFGAAGLVQAIATGYFVWDLIVTAFNIDAFGIPNLMHASAVLLVYSLGFVCDLLAPSLSTC